MSRTNPDNPVKKSDKKDSNIAEEPYIEWGLADAAEKISRGLSTDVLYTLQSRLQLSNRELSYLLMISPRTLDRRKNEQRLAPDESERCLRVVRLTDMAGEIFGTLDKAASWFKQSNFALGNQKPIEMVRTEPGARLVERTLGQIRHGITV